jgi:hypothetical protein
MAELLDGGTYASHANLTPNLSNLDIGGSSVNEHDVLPLEYVITQPQRVSYVK